mgnify:CR=1 FL=1
MCIRDRCDSDGRIENFRETAKLLVEMYKEKNVHHHYQDDRAIMVYLNLRYPEKYYLYKYTMFKDFVERINYDEAPKSGEIENLFRFESLCNYIHNYIMQDEELLKLYEPRKEKYYDPEYHLLVQDIIYTTYYEAEPEIRYRSEKGDRGDVKRTENAVFIYAGDCEETGLYFDG